MLKIGITGGIGSGKSTVCSIFELFAIPVFYSDLEAKKIMDTDSSLKNELVNLFGKHVILESGLLDKKTIAAIVFNDNDKLIKLNKIIHPAVAMHFEKWLLQNKNAPYVLKEAAILFESGANKQMDKVIVVTAPKELRIERVLLRDRSNREAIELRVKNQMVDEELIKMADYVIKNDETQLVINQVLSIHNELLG